MGGCSVVYILQLCCNAGTSVLGGTPGSEYIRQDQRVVPDSIIARELIFCWLASCVWFGSE